MIIFTPNTVIRSTEINSNLDELKTKTDYLTTPDTGWIVIGSGGTAPAFQNSWVWYNDGGGVYTEPAFRKDALGYVHLKGLLKSGTTTVGTPMFTLPVGYRPLKILITIGFGASGAHRYDVNPSGTFTINSGTNGYCSIDGISFKAEQ